MIQMQTGEIYYAEKGLPMLIRITENGIDITENGIDVVGWVVYEKYTMQSMSLSEEWISPMTSLISRPSFSGNECRLLSESKQMGKWPIGALISHRGEAYEVLGYFRRFIAVKVLGTDRLGIIRRYHPTNHRYIML
jgi:hypothetical protein